MPPNSTYVEAIRLTMKVRRLRSSSHVKKKTQCHATVVPAVVYCTGAVEYCTGAVEYCTGAVEYCNGAVEYCTGALEYCTGAEEYTIGALVMGAPYWMGSAVTY